MATERFEPVFVEAMPEHLDEGNFYISIRFRTAAHLCACGCGSKIVTPIKPAKWKFTYNGESISLWPSVGNWQKPCRSHYVIENSRVRWAREWTDEEIAEGRARDQNLLRGYYQHANVQDISDRTGTGPRRESWWRRMLDKLFGRS